MPIECRHADARAMGRVLAGCLAMLPAAPSAASEREAQALMAALEQSPCRFQRNGSWYDGAAARAHLQRKYEYLRKRGRVGSTERFIELAASRSSVSGKPYRVHCPGQAERDAAGWFLQRLAELRRHGAS